MGAAGVSAALPVPNLTPALEMPKPKPVNQVPVASISPPVQNTQLKGPKSSMPTPVPTTGPSISNPVFEHVVLPNVVRQQGNGLREKDRSLDNSSGKPRIPLAKFNDAAMGDFVRSRNFEIHGPVLGGGGSAVRCVQSQIGDSFAMKVFKNLENFKNETKILKLVQGSEHVLKLTEWFEEDNIGVMITEYAPETLANLKRKSSLGELETKLIIEKVACGLSWIHSKDIVHGDKKPENIVIDFNNNYI